MKITLYLTDVLFLEHPFFCAENFMKSGVHVIFVLCASSFISGIDAILFFFFDKILTK